MGSRKKTAINVALEIGLLYNSTFTRKIICQKRTAPINDDKKNLSKLNPRSSNYPEFNYLYFFAKLSRI